MKNSERIAPLTNDVYITKEEVARRMCVTPHTIQVWMHKKKLPYVKIGHTVRFHWGDVREYLETQSRVEPQQPKQVRPEECIHDSLRQVAALIRQKARTPQDQTAPTVENANDQPISPAHAGHAPSSRLPESSPNRPRSQPIFRSLKSRLVDLQRFAYFSSRFSALHFRGSRSDPPVVYADSLGTLSEQ